MSIEFRIQSVVLQYEDIQKQCPDLVSMVNFHLPQNKIYQRRKPRKERQTVASLIDALIDTIE